MAISKEGGDGGRTRMDSTSSGKTMPRSGRNESKLLELPSGSGMLMCDVITMKRARPLSAASSSAGEDTNDSGVVICAIALPAKMVVTAAVSSSRLHACTFLQKAENSREGACLCTRLAKLVENWVVNSSVAGRT